MWYIEIKMFKFTYRLLFLTNKAAEIFFIVLNLNIYCMYLGKAGYT